MNHYLIMQKKEFNILNYYLFSTDENLRVKKEQY